MRLKTRLSGSGGFLEISIDEIEATVFKNSSTSEETIQNLIEVIEEICKLENKEFIYSIEKIQNG